MTIKEFKENIVSFEMGLSPTPECLEGMWVMYQWMQTHDKQMIDKACEALYGLMCDGLCDIPNIEKAKEYMRNQLGKEIHFPTNNQNSNN